MRTLPQQPTETDLIKEQLRTLASSVSTQDDRLFALRQLKDLVAPLDNANDLKVRCRQAAFLQLWCWWCICCSDTVGEGQLCSSPVSCGMYPVACRGSSLQDVQQRMLLTGARSGACRHWGCSLSWTPCTSRRWRRVRPT